MATTCEPIELLKKLETEELDSFTLWSQVQQIVQLLLQNKRDLSNFADCCSLVSQLFQRCVSMLLTNGWAKLVNIYNTKPEMAIAHAVSFTTGHRLLANLLKNHHVCNDILDGNEYNCIVAKSLHTYMYSMHTEQPIMLHIVINLSGKFQREFFVQLACSEPLSHVQLIPAVESLNVCVSLVTSLRRLFASNKRLHNASAFLRQLVESAVEAYPTPAVIDAVLLRLDTKQFASPKEDPCFTESDAAALIVDSFPGNAAPNIVGSIGLVWGDRSFVSRSSASNMRFLTSVLVRALGRLSADDLMRSSNAAASVPLAVILSTGVSHYLDAADNEARICGMRVARAYSSVLGGGELLFQELVAADAQEEQDCARAMAARRLGDTDTPCSSSSGAVGVGPVSGRGGRSWNNATSPVGVDEDSPPRLRTRGDHNDGEAEEEGSSYGSGGESEIEGFCLDGEDECEVEEGASAGELGGGGRFSTNYLRVCLEMLRYPESKPDAAKRHLAALSSITRIFEEAAAVTAPASGSSTLSRLLPSDSKDLCVPLLKELLVAVNTFNAEGFEDLRSAGIVALLVAHPHLAVPAINAAVVSADTPLGLRINCLAWLCRAACVTAGIDAQAVNEQYGASDAESSVSSTVRRPVKLSVSKRKVTYRRNKFGAVAELYFGPVFRLLRSSLKTHSIEVTNIKSAAPSIVGRPNALIVDLSDSGPSLTAAESGASTDAPPSRPVMVGVDAMLPAQGLLSLATFVRCAVNTNSEQIYANSTLEIAGSFRDALDLSLRRAAVGAMLTAVQALIRRGCGGEKDRLLVSGSHSALENLTSIARTAAGEGDDGDPPLLSRLGEEERGVLVDATAWALDSLSTDSDRMCRLIKNELISSVASVVGPLD